MNNEVKVAAKFNDSVWLDTLIKSANLCDDIFLNRQNRQEKESKITPAYSIVGLDKQYDAYVLYSNDSFDSDKFIALYDEVECSTNDEKTKLVIYYAPFINPNEPQVKSKVMMKSNLEDIKVIESPEDLSFNDVIDLAAFKYLEQQMIHQDKTSTLSKHSK